MSKLRADEITLIWNCYEFETRQNKSKPVRVRCGIGEFSSTSEWMGFIDLIHWVIEDPPGVLQKGLRAEGTRRFGDCLNRWAAASNEVSGQDQLLSELEKKAVLHRRAKAA